MPVSGLQCVESALAAQEEITCPRTGEIDAATVLLHLLIAQRTHQQTALVPGDLLGLQASRESATGPGSLGFDDAADYPS
jgi:hypothetical protein